MHGGAISKLLYDFACEREIIYEQKLMVYTPIFTFSNQSFNESLDFCLMNYTHLIDSCQAHSRVSRVKQASCLLHWLSVSKLVVQLLHFTF